MLAMQNHTPNPGGMDASIARPRPFVALALRLAAAFALATMAMLVKVAGSRGVHLGELLFWRQAITFPVIIAIMAMTGRLAQLRTHRMAAHARRSVTGIVGMAFVYGAVLLLPLAEATTLSFTTPLFAVILAAVVWREPIGRYRWGAVLLGFAGVLVVMRPGGDMAAIDPLGLGVGLIAALMVAVVSFQIQDLNRTESPWAIVAWFTGLTAPLMALMMPFVAAPHDMATWAAIAGMGIAGAVAQILLTASLRYGSAATIIVMDYTALLWATLYGWQVFDRLPPPSLMLGAPLILSAGVVIAWREHRLARDRKSAGPAAGTAPRDAGLG